MNRQVPEDDNHFQFRGILADWQIEKCIRIEPFSPCVKRPGVISYGLTSFGYDVRIADEYLIVDPSTEKGVIDPKHFDKSSFREVKGEGFCIIPPNSFALGRSVERLEIPEDVITICIGKSTYARCGIIVNVTPLEPAWEGYITIEISNTTPNPAKIYSDEGIMQVMFFRGCEPRVNYETKNGRYQNQVGITLPTSD